MSAGVPALKGAAYTFYVGLVDQSNTKLLKADPTIAAGDFKVSKDGGAFANLTTLPTVGPAAGTAVLIPLSATEMNADDVVVACIDAAGAEWCDQLIHIKTAAAQIGDAVALSATGMDAVIMSDITAVPAITASVKAAINWLFCLHRNKRTQSATTETVYKDNGSSALATSTKSDDGTTFTRGKMT